MKIERIGKAVLDAAVMGLRELGVGLLESVYEIVLEYELGRRDLQVQWQVPIHISYQDKEFPEAFRIDIMGEGMVVLELKSVEEVNRAHFKQTLTYLRLANKRLGFLLNFGAPTMKEGITRIVNKL